MTSSLAHYPENDIILFVHVHEYIKTYRIKMDPQCKQNYVFSMFTGKCLKMNRFAALFKFYAARTCTVPYT